MDYLQVSQISAEGMLAQKARIEAAAANLANMYTTRPSGSDPYRPVVAVIRPSADRFGALMTGNALPRPGIQVEIVPQADAPVRQAYEPGHPHADASGMVTYPGVDHTTEMMTVMTALRAYEANLAALQANKTLAAKALEIGGQ